MTKDFKDFMAEISQVEDRKTTAQAEVDRLMNLKFTRETEYTTLEVLGNDTKAAKKELDTIEAELKAATRKAASFNGKMSIVDILRGTKTLTDKAEAILKDNLKAIDSLQQGYDVKAKELGALKEQFLSIVADMGNMQRLSDEHARECRELVKYVPGQENVFISSIDTGISEGHGRGSIFIPSTESLQAFKSVR